MTAEIAAAGPWAVSVRRIDPARQLADVLDRRVDLAAELVDDLLLRRVVSERSPARSRRTRSAMSRCCALSCRSRSMRRRSWSPTSTSRRSDASQLAFEAAALDRDERRSRCRTDELGVVDESRVDGERGDGRSVALHGHPDRASGGSSGSRTVPSASTKRPESSRYAMRTRAIVESAGDGVAPARVGRPGRELGEQAPQGLRREHVGLDEREQKAEGEDHRAATRSHPRSSTSNGSTFRTARARWNAKNAGSSNSEDAATAIRARRRGREAVRRRAR